MLQGSVLNTNKTVTLTRAATGTQGGRSYGSTGKGGDSGEDQRTLHRNLFFFFLLHVSWGLNTGLLAWQPYLQALFFVFNKTSCSPNHYVAKYGIKLLVLLPPPFIVRPEIPDLGFVSAGD